MSCVYRDKKVIEIARNITFTQSLLTNEWGTMCTDNVIKLEKTRRFEN